MRYTIEIEKRTTKSGNVFEALMIFVGDNEELFYKTFTKLCEAFMTAENLERVSFKREEGFTHAYIEVKL